MILLNNVSFKYRKGAPVVRDLSLDIKPGTICGLLGPNGVGKSTILYLICGLLRPQEGQIMCNQHIPFNREIDFLNDIFILPEEFSLPNVTLEQFIDVNAPFYPKFNKEQMLDNLREFELPANIHPAKLSMGQKKKIYISFALACNTSILLLDEPTNGLDIPSKRIFRQLVSRCMNDDKSIIISTHQVYDIEKILDHIIIADENGIRLNASMMDIASKLRFTFTNDPIEAQNAIIALHSLGGFNIVEPLLNPELETEVNLESLFELTLRRPNFVNNLFSIQ